MGAIGGTVAHTPAGATNGTHTHTPAGARPTSMVQTPGTATIPTVMTTPVTSTPLTPSIAPSQYFTNDYIDPPLCFKMARDLRCVLHPAPSAAGCKTRFKSRTKRLKPRFVYCWCCRPFCGNHSNGAADGHGLVHTLHGSLHPFQHGLGYAAHCRCRHFDHHQLPHRCQHIADCYACCDHHTCTLHRHRSTGLHSQHSQHSQHAASTG